MIKLNKLIVIILLTTLFGCAGTVEKRRNIICLIDFSGTINQKTLDTYTRILSKDVLLNLGKYDKLAILPIDEGAKTNPVYLGYFDLSSENFENSNDGLTHKEELEKKRVKEFLINKSDSLKTHLIEQKESRKMFTNYTDIVNAIGQVYTKLEKNEEISDGQEVWNGIVGETTFDVENILIICSDMIHESKEINFRNSNSDRLKFFLTELKNSNRIVDLSNVAVFINGRTGSNNKTVENVEQFWKSYFREANANLKSYEFDSHNSIINYLK